MKTKELIAEISDLPVEERVIIAEKILQTLNAPSPVIESAWIKAVEKRVEEFENGDVGLIPAEIVFKSLREITK